MIIKAFLEHQINTLANLYDVTIITKLDKNSSNLDGISKSVNIVHLPIERDVSLFADVKALFLLVLSLYKGRFSLVHSVSPKAGLLTSIAARLVFVPNRLHTFTGQVWVTRKGFWRWLLRLMDKVIVMLNTNILVDSFSQRDFLASEKVLLKSSSIVLGRGSISGVDVSRFSPSNAHRDLVRRSLNINDGHIIFLFVGRLKKEKGVFELVRAFSSISNKYKNIALLIVGPDEEGLKHTLIENLSSCRDMVRFVDFTKTPEIYMSASDVFVLPSYREGFGSVIIEAASCGLPSIGSDIYGIRDAISPGRTGLLVSTGNSDSLEETMLKLINNQELRTKMAKDSRKYATHYFSQSDITSKVLQLYKDLLKR